MIVITIYVLIFLVGLCLGSFGNVLVYRMPLQLSLRSRSCCVSCGRQIAARHLVPVLSWILLRGKCRHCGAGISCSYPILELAVGAIFVLVAFLGSSPHYAFLGVACFLMCVICVIDVKTKTIPDILVVAVFLSGMCWVLPGWESAGQPFSSLADILDAFLGAAIGGSVFVLLNKIVLVVLKKPGFGMGDAKLMAALGLFLGLTQVFLAIGLAFIAAGLFGGMSLAVGFLKRGAYIPFAPFLCAGSVAAFLYGAALLGLIGL